MTELWTRALFLPGCFGALFLLPASSEVNALAPFAGEAFPGAEGFGRFAAGGRAGAVIAVTHLGDSGPGSLRACIDATGRRTCIFRVAGIIRFSGVRPVIRNPYLTIAGQTAPGGGVTITHSGGADGLTPLLIKDTHDVVIRHVRVRIDRPGTQRAGNSGFVVEASRNVILDHVSASWAQDENLGHYAQNDNVTISWSIFAEGVPRHDKCALLASDSTGPQRISFIKNLCAHNGDRNPDVNFWPGSCVEIGNNVLYNAQSAFTEVWASHGGSPVSIVGNYYKAGANTTEQAPAIVRQTIGATGNARVHLSGNVFDGIGRRDSSLPPVEEAAPICPLGFALLSARDAYRRVLGEAGAFPRDPVDARIVDETRGRRGRIVRAAGSIPQPAPGEPYVDQDGDGMADDWERSRGLDPTTADPWSDADGNGWRNLEEFLDFAHRSALAGRAIP